MLHYNATRLAKKTGAAFSSIQKETKADRDSLALVFPLFASALSIYFEFSVDLFIRLSSSFVIGQSWRGRSIQYFREAGSRYGLLRSLFRGSEQPFPENVQN